MFSFSRQHIFIALLTVILISGCQKDNPPEPEFESLVEELDYLADKYMKMGAAIGIIDQNQQQQEFYYGSLSRQNSSPPNEHSVFEIGSITKSFTTTLLARMILDGKISLNDEVEPLLPQGEVTVPVRGNTSITIEHLATGHDERRDSVKNYNANDIFQGAGFMKSSLHDMLIYLKAQMGLSGTSLGDAMVMTQQSCFDVGGVTYNDREGYYHLSIGLAWHIDLLPEGYTFHWHGGRTNGYMAYMAFDLSAMTGAVILCNQSYADVIIRFGEDVLKAVNKY